MPVVISEGSVSTPDYTTFASLNTVGMGELQAEGVAKALGGKGNIVILQGVAGSGPVVAEPRGHEESPRQIPRTSKS